MAHLDVTPADLQRFANDYAELQARATALGPHALDAVQRIIATHGPMGYPVAVGVATGLARRQAALEAKATDFGTYSHRFTEHAAVYTAEDRDAARRYTAPTEALDNAIADAPHFSPPTGYIIWCTPGGPQRARLHLRIHGRRRRHHLATLTPRHHRRHALMTIETQADVARIMIERNVSFHFQPLLTQQDNGTWTARYPGADWTVTGATEADARAALRAEELRIIDTPEATSWKITAVRQHLENGPIPGVYELDNTAADRAINAGTPQAMAAALTATEHRPH